MLNESSPATNREILEFADKDGLSRYVADRFFELAAHRHQQGLPFTVALAGGSTPELMYKLLAASNHENQTLIDWKQVYFFFGDERSVPADAPESNFRLAKETLFSHVDLPVKNIFRMPAEFPDHDDAARQYEAILRRYFDSGDTIASKLPRIDLILLGIGTDGHTASLFPHKPALQESKRLVVATEPGLKPFVPRLTLTYPVLNNAANVIFLVSGEDKADVLARVLEGPADPEGLPSQNIAPANGKLIWLIDSEAASKLRSRTASRISE